MKPRATLKELRAAGGRLCWRADLAVPHESLWARMRKFAAFNRVYGSDLMRLFHSREIPRFRTYDRCVSRDDLRFAMTLDKAELKALAADEHSATVGIIGDYIESAEDSRNMGERWSFGSVRYCSECLQLGIHVTYFQLVCVKKCPVHQCSLECACPRCGCEVSYSPPKSAKEATFGCSCGHTFWQWEGRLPPSSEWLRLRRSHDEAGGWLTQALKKVRLLHYPPCGDDFETDRRGNRFASISTFFALAFPREGKLSGNFLEEATKHYSHSWILGSMKESSSGGLNQREYAAIYKSICRHLYRKRLRKFRFAIRVLAREAYSTEDKEGQLFWLYPFAPAAFAFIAWRMF